MPDDQRKEFGDMLHSSEAGGGETPSEPEEEADSTSRAAEEAPWLIPWLEQPEDEVTPAPEESLGEAEVEEPEEEPQAAPEPTPTRRISLETPVTAYEPEELAEKTGEAVEDIVTSYEPEELAEEAAGIIEDTARELTERDKEDAQPKEADDSFYLTVRKMFREIQACAMERLHAAEDDTKRALAQLQETHGRLEEREEEVRRFRSEVDAERNRVRSFESQMTSLREEIERQAAGMVDNTYLEELNRRLGEAYSVLGAIEEAYLTGYQSRPRY